MSIFRQASWLVGGRVVSDALSFVFYLAVARAFGQAGVGDYSFAFALAALAGLGVEFGLRPYLTRTIARAPERATEYAGTIVAAQLGLAVALGGILHFVALTSDYPRSLHVLLMVGFAGMALRGIGITFVAFLEGVDAMDRSALLEVIAKLVVAVTGLALILAGSRLEVVMAAHILGNAAFLAVAIRWVVARFGGLSLAFHPPLVLETFRAALPFVGAAALYELYARVDILMLHRMVGDVETGTYAVAVRFVTAPLAVANLIGLAFYPSLSRTAVEARARLDRLFRTCLRSLGLMAMLGLVLFLTIGDPLLVLVFGEQFTGSGTLVPWLAVVFFVQFMGVAYWRLLMAVNREGSVLRIQLVGTCVNIGLNLALIPVWAGLGAAWASIASEVLILIGLHRLTRREISAPYAGNAVRLLAAGGAGTATGLLVRSLFNWPTAAVVATAAAVAVAFALRIVRSEDLRRIVAEIPLLRLGGSAT